MGLHAIKKRQPIVIPFYVCDIHDPILSVTRLAEQGFDIRFNDTPTMRHDKGFDVPLVQQHNLYYLSATVMNLGQHQQLQLRQTQKGMIAMTAPTTLTRHGPQQVLGGNSDYWNYNNEGDLVRHHRNKREGSLCSWRQLPSATGDIEQLQTNNHSVNQRGQ